MMMQNEMEVLGDCLETFIHSLPHPAHVKDISGKYLISNNANLAVYGLKQQSDILGTTVNELDSFMRPFWGDSFSKTISKWDYEVIHDNKKQSHMDILFSDTNGFLHIQNMVKVPVLSKKRNMGVLTLSYEITQSKNTYDLFALYRKYYASKRKAVDLFMKYKSLDYFFNESPTCSELKCLLLMEQDRCHKFVANHLNVSVKTIETHVSSILKKSKFFKINKILLFLRNRGKKGIIVE